MRLCELRQKEIINIRTCRSLGCPIDLEFDERSGKDHSTDRSRTWQILLFLGRESEFIIPWSSVRQIGGDIILVELPEEKCPHR